MQAPHKENPDSTQEEANKVRRVDTPKAKFDWHRIVGRYDKLTPKMVRALMGFFDRYNLETGCWPSHETIAKEYGVSVRTSKDAVKIARDAGLMQSKARYHDSHIWTLTIPEHLEHLADLQVDRSESAAHCTSTPDDDEKVKVQPTALPKVKVQKTAESKCSPLPPNTERTSSLNREAVTNSLSLTKEDEELKESGDARLTARPSSSSASSLLVSSPTIASSAPPIDARKLQMEARRQQTDEIDDPVEDDDPPHRTSNLANEFGPGGAFTLLWDERSPGMRGDRTDARTAYTQAKRSGMSPDDILNGCKPTGASLREAIETAHRLWRKEVAA